MQKKEITEELIFAWEVTSPEQFFDRLNKIIAFDENAYWYNLNCGPTEKASDFNDENNKFRLQLKEIHKDTFKNGLFLVYNGCVVKETTDPFGMGPTKRLRGRLQMESLEWVKNHNAVTKFATKDESFYERLLQLCEPEEPKAG